MRGVRVVAWGAACGGLLFFAATNVAVGQSEPISPPAGAATTAPTPAPASEDATQSSTESRPLPSTDSTQSDDVAAPATRPFGPGVSVEIDADKPWIYAYIAKGVVETERTFPDPFVKVGTLPLTVELPPGKYTMIVEGDTVTSASRVFEVKKDAMRLRVSGGSQSLRDLGTLLSAIGGAAVIAGVVVELSRTANEDSSAKRKISLPLLIGGGVGLAGGVTMMLVSGTSVEEQRKGPTPSGRRELIPVLTWQGRF